ncbi:hypothetical protein EBR21_03155 [bacterium]|nr:hypothetical protein [bacterium]
MVAFFFFTVMAGMGLASEKCHARTNLSEFLRPESYTLDFYSGRGNEKPKLSANWASGIHQGENFKVPVPPRFVAAKKLIVNYRWSVGSQWAGLSEGVELHWRKPGQPWRVAKMGQGFRDPQSGQLLLFPAQIELEDGRAGNIEFKFMLALQNGEVIQDGGEQTFFSVYVLPNSISGRINFFSDWSSSVVGRLVNGRSFELLYEVERLVRQIDLHGDEPCPWSVIAHVQFDDLPVEEYPVVVVVPGHSNRVLPFAPTIAVPENARRMSIWFLAFHDARSYFDSNYGMNFNFDILNERRTR